MLSILIPIYNFDVRPLVETLHQLGLQTQKAFEIICYDDDSQTSFKEKHRALSTLPYVNYQELPQNVGRSAIRNALAKAAQYPYLLFMDGDSKVVEEQYLKKYLDHIAPQTLLYGGRCYDVLPPQDKTLYFHWFYGKQREETLAKERKEKPYHSFMSNNFLIPKTIFIQIGGFDERLTQYGHEDTVLGLELQKWNIPILHLDNPLEHIGLETTTAFLHKTQQGLDNLLFLAKAYPTLDTKLLRAFKWVKRLGLNTLLGLFFKWNRTRLERNFHSSKPNLRGFDLYKLGYLALGAQASLPVNIT